MTLPTRSDVAVWSCGRLSSSRCPQKMIRPFAGTTLTDILLSKLARLPVDSFFAGYDDVFAEKCAAHGVRFVQRRRESALADGPASLIYEFLRNEPYEYVLHVNACVPFLTRDTILGFLRACEAEKRPSFGVYRVQDFFVRPGGEPVNFPADLTTINTKTVEPLYQFAHVLYFYEREHFLKTGRYWDWREVRYVELGRGVETLDIDTEQEFLIAEALWPRFGAAALA